MGRVMINRTGETNINKQGLKMTILRWGRCDDIDVIFEDGYIAVNKRYNKFKDGGIINKNFNHPAIIDRTGETIVNNQGLKATIIKYRNAKDIDIEFEDGYIEKHVIYKNFKDKCIESRFFPTLLGKGFLGGETSKKDISFKKWRAMIVRCYGKDTKEKHPTYQNCDVCDEWLNYQNFKKWFEENYYEIDGEKMYLDKDILIKGNKIYSPETCVFVNKKINNLFTKSDKARGDYPIGVFKLSEEKGGKYGSQCKLSTKNSRHLGYFDTPEEAFYAYKVAKENEIKLTADQYKDKIPEKLYNAMYNYKVEITD